MEEGEWESEEEEEEGDGNDEEEQGGHRITSFPTNSPFRLSNFPRVPPYYRSYLRGTYLSSPPTFVWYYS